jgi:hypothetical protein
MINDVIMREMGSQKGQGRPGRTLVKYRAAALAALATRVLKRQAPGLPSDAMIVRFMVQALQAGR